MVPPPVVPGEVPVISGVDELVPPEAPPEALPLLPLSLLPAPALPLAPALEPDDPPAPPPALPLPPLCANVAVDRPSSAAAIAAVSTFIFIMWNAL
jgi:hypothetical protein